MFVLREGAAVTRIFAYVPERSFMHATVCWGFLISFAMGEGAVR
jgi:hypothetical protein